MARILCTLGFASTYGAMYKDNGQFHKHSAPQRTFSEEKPLTVHLIAHTHDDVGWLKTVDQYFLGQEEDIQAAYVFKIIDTSMNELIMDASKARRFTYVEMKFFSMWFYLQGESKREAVRILVREGRLEFVNAGWSMHDEAATHFDDMVNNMMYGH